MSLIAICQAPGTSASTTTALALAALAPIDQLTVMIECDSSGGDICGWANLTGSPSWASAVAGADRSWDGFRRHLQRLPSDLPVMVAPPTIERASAVVDHAAERFAPTLRDVPDVMTFADCGRVVGSTTWLGHADAIVVLLRQAAAAGATLTRIDRTIDLCRKLKASGAPIALVVVGHRPYRADEVAVAASCPLLGTLPEDPAGAALAAGAWTIGKGASRTALARSAAELCERVIEFTAASAGSRHGRDLHANAPVEVLS